MAAYLLFLFPSGAHVAGSLQAPAIVIQDGAFVDAAVEMQLDVSEGSGRGRGR